MNLLDYLKEIPNLFNWYFKLPLTKRISLNYIVLLATVMTMAYYNDKLHREHYTVLANRNDTINNSRTKEQEKYTAKLEFYTDKFNHLLELLIQQRKEREQLKNEP